MKKRILSKTACELTIFCVLVVILAVRLRYGFDPADESHYYALAKRFWQGDRPFIDEWHPSQFFAVLLYPFYSLYSFFVPSTEGVILAGRYAYLGIQVIVSLYIFGSFREEKYRLALTIIYLMCCRQNIPGLSYYSLFTSCVLVATISIYNYLCRKSKIMYFVIAGVAVSVATICMPFLAIGVFLFVIYLLLKKRYKMTLVFMLSIGICALLYILFLLSRASLAEYLVALKYVMASPDHTGIISTDKIIGTILSVGKACVLGIPGFIYLMTRLIIVFVNRQNGDCKEFFCRRDRIVCYVSILLCVLSFGLIKPGAIYLQITVLFLPYILSCLILGDLKKVIKKRRIVTLYSVGIGVAFLFWLGSNTEASCLSTGFLISTLAVCMFLDDIFVYEKKELLMLLKCCILIAAVSARILGPCYHDARLWELDTIITSGPAKGLHTEKEDADDYYAVMEMVDIIEKNVSPEKKVLFTYSLPWGYLACNLRNGAETTWETPIGSKRLIQFYEINPDQFPDVIVSLNVEIGKINGLDGGVPLNNWNKPKGKVWEKIKDSYSIETSAGTIYFYSM